MNKLLNASFARLFKSKIFWLLSIFSVGFSLVLVYGQYRNMIMYGETVELGLLMLCYPILIGIVCAVFISLFLGVEYSDGIIRNKISIGHKRMNIYLTNFIVSSVVSLFFYVIFLLTTFLVGIPLFGLGTISISLIIKKVFVLMLTILAYSSIFTFIASVCSNKTMTSIITILLAFGLIFVATYCYNILNTPEYIQLVTVVDGNTEMKEEHNSKYPSPTKRKVYEELLSLNPAGQAIQMQEGNSNFGTFIGYSLGILVVFTCSGLVLFNKKELK